MKRVVLLTAILMGIAIANRVSLFNSTPQSIQIAADAPVLAQGSFDYQDYRQVLADYVDERGLVDYQGLQQNREQLDRFNQSLGAVSPATYGNWDQAEQIAFLINAYNAFTLQSIIDQEPLKASIRDIRGVWNRRKFNLAGSEKTLDNIEHDILRQEFNEPRIHVALVCAAKSCPPLRNEPYLPATLETQLADQTTKFAASPHGLQIDRQDNRVYLSAIFKWYGKDFIPSYGVAAKFGGNESQRAVLNYFSAQLNAQERQFLEQGNYQVKYLDYDWSLNQQ